MRPEGLLSRRSRFALRGHEEGERDAISKHDWDKKYPGSEEPAEKSSSAAALACLFISYRESGQRATS